MTVREILTARGLMLPLEELGERLPGYRDQTHVVSLSLPELEECTDARRQMRGALDRGMRVEFSALLTIGNLSVYVTHDRPATRADLLASVPAEPEQATVIPDRLDRPAPGQGQPCIDCAPEYGCWSGSVPCCKAVP